MKKGWTRKAAAKVARTHNVARRRIPAPSYATPKRKLVEERQTDLRGTAPFNDEQLEALRAAWSFVE